MTTSNNSPRLVVRLLGYVLFLLIPILLAILLEFSGFLYLKHHGLHTYRLLVKRGEFKEAEGIFDRQGSLSYLDPHLSHSHNPTHMVDAGMEYIPGFSIFGEKDNPDAFTIIALGGSTTDPLGGKSWPQFLAERLLAEGYSVRVLNGGVAAYTSNQEFLKLIRDALPLEPDLIISLNGVNDLGYMHSVLEHPMVHPYQERVLRSISDSAQPTSPILPNAVGAALMLFRGPPAIGVNLGTTVKRRDYEQWFGNVRMMHAVSSEFGIPYLCFLQPILGVGEYHIVQEEQAMLDKTIRQLASQRDYLDDVEKFYTGARASAEGTPYIIDFVDIFAGKQEMYGDSRHPNYTGRKLLGNSIFEFCRAHGLLEAVAEVSNSSDGVSP